MNRALFIHSWLVPTILAVLAMGMVSTPAAAAQPVPTGNEYKLKVLTHNIAGGPMNDGAASAIDEMAYQIDTWGPDVIMMQEVCIQQRDAFVARYPGWGWSYTPMRQAHPGCGNQPQGQLLASPHPYSALPNVPLFEDDGDKRFTLTCAMLQLSYGTTKVCTTHLRAYSSGAAARERQTRIIKDTLSVDIANGTRVVVAGDFNAVPYGDPMDNLYRLAKDDTFTGPGQFFEADQTDSCTTSHGACRGGDPTMMNISSKYDYIFYSNNLTYGYPKWLSGGVLASSTSDHRLVRGWALVKHTG